MLIHYKYYNETSNINNKINMLLNKIIRLCTFPPFGNELDI